MQKSDEILAARASYSKGILDLLRRRVAEVPDLRQVPGLCLYATGSFARGEASEYSDLDVFFIDSTEKCPRIQSILITADLIRICRDLNLPEFSSDGQFLAVHQLREICDQLGGAEDDYRNLFTARLLLLLESSPIWHDELYHEIVGKIIESYYRDYHDHNESFKPIFLVNDIIRFWKTLCLNYEHKRNRLSTEQTIKNKSHVKNLKLKFSRMTTCFSAVIGLASTSFQQTPEGLLELVRLPPFERLRRAASADQKRQQVFEQLVELYAWFLVQTAIPTEELSNWIGESSTREMAFKKAQLYGDTMYNLLQLTAPRDVLRFLVI
jgi:hypothetical protein